MVHHVAGALLGTQNFSVSPLFFLIAAAAAFEIVSKSFFSSLFFCNFVLSLVQLISSFCSLFLGNFIPLTFFYFDRYNASGSFNYEFWLLFRIFMFVFVFHFLFAQNPDVKMVLFCIQCTFEFEWNRTNSTESTKRKLYDTHTHRMHRLSLSMAFFFI